MPSYDPICLLCARARAGGVTCDAFPGGIPSDILRRRSLHQWPRKGDRGLTFKLADDADTVAAARLLVAAGDLPSSVLEP